MGFKKWYSTEDRFWSKVSVKDLESCWLWIASTNGNGYGQFMFMVNGRWKPVAAHRVSYEMTFGEIFSGLHIDHLCRNKLCVNPHHLEAVTQEENNKRMGLTINNLGQYMPRGSNEFIVPLRTCCRKGHEFTEETTYTKSDGRRQCRICRRMREGSVSRENYNTIRQTKSSTHCKNGHERSPDNTYIRPNGWRECKDCRRLLNIKEEIAERIG